MLDFLGIGEEAETSVVRGASDDETVVEEKPQHPMPDEISRRCTDWPFLILTLLTIGGAVWFLQPRMASANLDVLKEGYSLHELLCGWKERDNETTYIFWCKNSTDNGIDWNFQHCVNKCPSSVFTNHTCSNGLQEDYTSVAFGLFCLPMQRGLRGQVADAFTDSRGFFLRLAGVYIRQWYLVFGASVIGLFIGYLYVASILLGDAKAIVHVVLNVITYLPLCTGPYLLAAYFHPGASWDIYSYVQLDDDSEQQQKLNVGVTLTMIGIVMWCVVHNYKAGIDGAAKCLEASGDCLIEEWSVLVVPFAAVILEVPVIACFVYSFLCLAANAKAKEIIEEIGEGNFMDPQYLHLDLEELLNLFVLVSCTSWLMQAILSASRAIIAFIAESWYFTKPEVSKPEDSEIGDRIRVRPWGCLFCKACFNILTFHLGTVCLCGFLRSFAFFPAYVCRCLVLSRVAPRGSVVDHFYHAVLGDGPDFALIDLPLHSETFFQAGFRAREALRGELGHIHELKGALKLFHLAGVGLCCAGAAYVTNFITSVVPSFHDPTSNLFIFEGSLVFMLNGLAGLLIGHNIMLGFDTVFDTIMYSYAIQLKRNKQDAAFEDQGRAMWWIPPESDEEPDPEENEFLTRRMMKVYEEHLQSRQPDY